MEVVTREAAGFYEGDTAERERVRQGFGAFEQTNTAPHTSRQSACRIQVRAPKVYRPHLACCYVAVQ